MVITQCRYIHVLRMISLLVLYKYIVIISDYMVITQYQYINVLRMISLLVLYKYIVIIVLWAYNKNFFFRRVLSFPFIISGGFLLFYHNASM